MLTYFTFSLVMVFCSDKMKIFLLVKPYKTITVLVTHKNRDNIGHGQILDDIPVKK